MSTFKKLPKLIKKEKLGALAPLRSQKCNRLTSQDVIGNISYALTAHTEEHLICREIH